MYSRFLVRLVPLVVLAIAACKDGTGPRAPGSVEIVSGEDQQAFAGATLADPLVVRVLGRDGEPLGGAKVTWSVESGGGSITPVTATTNASGLAQAEWTLGTTTGEQEAAARVGSLPPARFDVIAQPPFGDPGCFGSPIALALGATQTFAGAQAAEICVSVGPGGGDYVAVVHHGDISTQTVRLQAQGILAGATANVAEATPSLSWSAPVRGGLTPQGARLEPLSRDDAFHAALRARERDLAPLFPMARAARSGSRTLSSSGPRFAIGTNPPQVGQIVTINAQAASACSNPINKQGRIAAISQRAIIVHDTQNPADGFTDAEYLSIATTFDTLIHPLEVDNFGASSDIDANSRAFIFYTNEVNKLTERGSDSYIGGFYFARDLFPKVETSTMQGCPSSNEAEIFYMLVPDPNATVSDARSKEFVLRVTLGTLAHEYQHLINASRRIFVNNAPGFEHTWLDEGLSHIAEELTFYRSAALAPKSNLGLDEIRSTPGRLEAFNRFGISNVFRLEEFLVTPYANSPYNTNDQLSTRGAAWSLLRYLADRRGGTESQFWFDLVNGSGQGLAKLEQVLGGSVHPYVRDWTAALLLDDLVPASTVHTMPSWNLRSIFSANPPFDGTYPLAITNLGSTLVTRDIIGGGAAYLRLVLGTNATGAFQLRTNGGVPASDVSVTLARTR